MAVTEHGVKIVAELDTSKVQAQLQRAGLRGGGNQTGGDAGGERTSASQLMSQRHLQNLTHHLQSLTGSITKLSNSVAKLTDTMAQKNNDIKQLLQQYKASQSKHEAPIASAAPGLSQEVTKNVFFKPESERQAPLWVQSIKNAYDKLNDMFQRSPLGSTINKLEQTFSKDGGVSHAKKLSGALLFGHLFTDLSQQYSQAFEPGTMGNLAGQAAGSVSNVATSAVLGFAINPVAGFVSALTSGVAEIIKSVKMFEEAVKSVAQSLEKGITIQEDATFKQGLKSKGTDFLDKEHDKAQKQLEYYNKARDAAFKELQASTNINSKLGTFEKAAAAKSWTGLMEKYQREADKQQKRLDAIEKRREELSNYDDESWWIENRGVAEEKEWWSGEKLRAEEEKKRKDKQKALEDERYAHLGEMRSIRIQGEAVREQVAQALLRSNPNEWKGIASIEQDFGRQKLRSFDLMNELEEKLLQERDTDKRRELANRLSEEQARYSAAESILKMIPVEKQIEWLGLGNMTSLAAKGGMMGEKDNTARMWNKLEKIVDELDSIRMNTADQRWSTFR